jgi:hypothetical protein
MLVKLTKGRNMGRSNFISLKQLKDKAADRLPDGSLKLGCDLTITDTEAFDESYNDTSLKRDLRHLLNNEILSDFKLVCKGQVFPCHKAILAARYLKFQKSLLIKFLKSYSKVNSFLKPFFLFTGQLSSLPCLPMKMLLKRQKMSSN